MCQSKQCNRCLVEKPLEEFHTNPKGKYGRKSICKSCVWEYNKSPPSRQRIRDRGKLPSVKAKGREWKVKNKERGLLAHAKSRAKEKNIEFNIELQDIHIPDTCPILGIPIIRDSKGISDNSPTLDRIDSSKGYIKGNVMVISYRANTIKSFGTAEEHRKIAEFLEETNS